MLSLHGWGVGETGDSSKSSFSGLFSYSEKGSSVPVVKSWQGPAFPVGETGEELLKLGKGAREDPARSPGLGPCWV
jgi:hypothetical protein